MIPFSPPRIDQKIIDEVVDTLKSGWITTGPKTKQFEKQIAQFCGAPAVLGVSAWTTGGEMILKWFGIKEGDEVIVPAYTYCATANIVKHCGAIPVMVDCGKDFNVDMNAIERAITSKTKAIIPVDIGGWPCDYQKLYEIINSKQALFNPANDTQKKLGRILVLSDSAHSIGATSKGINAGMFCDLSVFSFHAVKNVTTAEGGAICFNMPAPFNNEELYKTFNTLSLHGQSKDALAKYNSSNKASWEYDVIEPGFKCNMTDIQASMGMVELGRYREESLPRRKIICNAYTNAFAANALIETPLQQNEQTESSYHLYPITIKGATLQQRNAIIDKIFELGVSVNVHYKPLPLLTAYNEFNISDYPVALDKYHRVITLPVYFNLSDSDVQTVINAVNQAIEQVIL